MKLQAPPPPKPVQAAQKLRAALVSMKQQNPGQDDQLKACWSLLLRYCGNIAQVCLAGLVWGARWQSRLTKTAADRLGRWACRACWAWHGILGYDLRPAHVQTLLCMGLQCYVVRMVQLTLLDCKGTASSLHPANPLVLCSAAGLTVSPCIHAQPASLAWLQLHSSQACAGVLRTLPMRSIGGSSSAMQPSSPRWPAYKAAWTF